LTHENAPPFSWQPLGGIYVPVNLLFPHLVVAARFGIDARAEASGAAANDFLWNHSLPLFLDYSMAGVDLQRKSLNLSKVSHSTLQHPHRYFVSR